MYQFFNQVTKLAGHNILVVGAGTAIYRCGQLFFSQPVPQVSAEPKLDSISGYHSPKE